MKRIRDYKHKKGYSVFENKDKELVAKIKAIKPRVKIEIGSVINLCLSGDCEVISYINENELLIYSKEYNFHEVYQLENEPEYLRNEHLQLINDTFSVEDYFLSNFGVIYCDNKAVVGLDNLMPDNQFNTKKAYDEVSLASLKYVTINVFQSSNSFKFEYSNYYESVGCFFDENGNYVNRDYNLNLEEFKPISLAEFKKIKIDEYIKNVSKILPDELYHIEGADIWSSESVTYKLSIKTKVYELEKEFNLHFVAKQKQGKSCEDNVVSKESLINVLKSKIEEGVSLK